MTTRGKQGRKWANTTDVMIGSLLEAVQSPYIGSLFPAWRIFMVCKSRESEKTRDCYISFHSAVTFFKQNFRHTHFYFRDGWPDVLFSVGSIPCWPGVEIASVCDMSGGQLFWCVWNHRNAKTSRSESAEWVQSEWLPDRRRHLVLGQVLL